MKYGYARVSTLDQKLENQIEQLKDTGADQCPYPERFCCKVLNLLSNKVE